MVRTFYIITVMFLILSVINIAAFALGAKIGNKRVAYRFKFAAALMMSATFISLIVTISLHVGG